MAVRIIFNVTPEQARVLDEAVKRGAFEPFRVLKAGILNATSDRDVNEREQEVESTVQSHVSALGFAPDGALWSVEEGGVVRRWDPHAQRQVEWHQLEETATIWCFNNTAQLLAAGGYEIAVWELASGKRLSKVPAPSWDTALAFSPDSQLLASGHEDGVIRVWDWRNHTLLHQLAGHEKPVTAVAFSKDGLHLASACENRLIRIWTATTGQLLLTLPGHTDRIAGLSWHPDGTRLVSGGWDNTARVWDVTTGQPIIILNSHAAQIVALAFSPDGQFLACADSESTISIWDFSGYKLLCVLREQVPECTCLAFSLDGQFLAAAGSDGMITLWNIRSELQFGLTVDPQLRTTRAVLSPDGRRPYRSIAYQG